MQFYVTGKKIMWLCPFIAIFLNCLFNLKLFSLKFGALPSKKFLCILIPPAVWPLWYLSDRYDVQCTYDISVPKWYFDGINI